MKHPERARNLTLMRRYACCIAGFMLIFCGSFNLSRAQDSAEQDTLTTSVVINYDEWAAWPVRSLDEVIGLQPRIFREDGGPSVGLHLWDDSGIGYELNGVRIPFTPRLPQSSVQQIRFWNGIVPAKYGDVQDGLVVLQTDRPVDRINGVFEGITSQAMDAYGLNLGSATVTGPIWNNRARWLLGGEWNQMDDGDPRRVDLPRLTTQARERLHAYPQTLVFRNLSTNETMFVPVQTGSLEGGTYTEFRGRYNIPAGYNGFTLVPSPLLLEDEDFTTERGQIGAATSTGSALASLIVEPVSSLQIQLGGYVQHRMFSSLDLRRMVYNADRMPQNEQDRMGLYGTVSFRPERDTRYQLNIGWSDFTAYTYDPAFSRSPSNLLFYGDIDHPANADLAKYQIPQRIDDESLGFVPWFRDGGLDWLLDGLLYGPGAPDIGYGRQRDRQLFVRVEGQTRFKNHQVRGGGTFDQRTHRFYQMSPGAARSLALIYADDFVEASDLGSVNTYEAVPAWLVAPFVRNYGYDVLGLEEVDGEDLRSFTGALVRSETNRAPFNMAPHRPLQYAGYLEDEFRVGPVDVSAGIRIDVFDNNALVLRDPFAVVPVVRVQNLDDGSAPVGVPASAAVYFIDDVNIAGYRDVTGRFYNREGARVGSTELQGSRPRELFREFFLLSDVFQQYRPQVDLQPRILVALNPTPGTHLWAYYGAFTQRPPASAYVTPGAYEQVRFTFAFLGNNRLDPEQFRDYATGLQHKFAPGAVTSVRVFHRQLRNGIVVARLRNAFPNAYSNPENMLDATLTGASLALDYQPDPNLGLRVDYTLSRGQFGIHQDPNRVVTIGGVPNAVPEQVPIHTGNLIFRYRLGPEMKLLEGLQLVVSAEAERGQMRPFYPIQTYPSTSLVQPLEAEVLPRREGRPQWRMLFNVRLEKSFQFVPGFEATAFLWIQNLLDRENILRTYPLTNQPDIDGFLNSSIGTIYLQTASPGAERHYRFRTLNPAHYGIPRMIRLGLKLAF